MSNIPKKLIIGSLAVAGFVTLLAILDLIVKVPFSGRPLLDTSLLIGAALTGYMCWESYKEMA
jgi:hypothetical protein